MAARKYGLVREPVAANGTADSPKVRGNRWGKAPSVGRSLVARGLSGPLQCRSSQAALHRGPAQPVPRLEKPGGAGSPAGNPRVENFPSWNIFGGEYPRLGPGGVGIPGLVLTLPPCFVLFCFKGRLVCRRTTHQVPKGFH